jgi:hypothetical protein
MSTWERDVQETYDRVADEYAARIFGELAHKPYPDVEHPSRRAYLLARKPPSVRS